MVSIISETTGEAVVPTKQVNPGSFTQELAPDSYSVIIQGLQPNHSNFQEFGYPLVYGRKNHVAVTAGNSTTAAITMVDFRLDHSPNEVGSYITPNPYDWGLGKLPQNLSVSGYTFNGWYSDSSFQTVITEFPDTTDYAHLSYPVAKFTQNGTTPGGTPLPTGTGIYFANATGTGTGDSPESPKAFSTLLSTLNAGSLSNSSSGYPKIYLLEDITISSGISISNKVHIIGAKGGIANEPVTITNTSFMLGADYSAITFGSNSYIIDNVTIHGGGTYRGISNNGTLTLDNCTITNCMATNGAGILNNGILTLEEGTSIINCSATGDGKSIYCDYEDGRTVKVNNYDFLSDAWYDSVIDETNPYSNTTWTITPPDTSVEGIYYANASGTGDGTTSEKARAFSALIADATLKNYSSDGCPRIYLLEDITGSFTISRNVRIEGVENEETHEKPTITGSGTPILTISNDVVCIIKGIDINGGISYRGITNNGTLTLNDCSITGRNSEGAGIYNKGTLTLENGTSISRDDTNSTKGKSIYCEYVDDKTVKVNNDIFTSDAWYDYSIDTTTPYDRDLWIKTAPTGTGIYFAKASGSGDGRSLNNARALSSLLSETLTNSSEGYPVIYLMENITISSGSSGLTISNKVKLIGAKGGVLNERVTIQKNGSSNSDSNTITFGSDSYIVQNVTIHGGGSNRGILNNGTLTLDNCEIKNASTEENGAGILNKGTVTLINGTSIIGNATEKGNSIYCDSENGSTVKVNDDTFTSDAWYDDYINATTPYNSSSWYITVSEGEGIYFATKSGAGTKDGLTPANAATLDALLNSTTSLNNYPGEAAPRIYVLEDLTGNPYTIDRNITLIGAKGGVVGQKVRFQYSLLEYPILTTSNDVSLQYCIIDGKKNNVDPWSQGIKTTGGNLTLENCEITDCKASNGGGISFAETGNLTLKNCEITNCTSSASGGGVYFGSTGELTITESTISSCSATGTTSYGGGIYLASGTATLDKTTITDCEATGATSYGGGIYAKGSVTLSITDSSISGCTAIKEGSGIYLIQNTTFDITNSSISKAETDSNFSSIVIADSNKVTLKTVSEEVTTSDTTTTLGLDSYIYRPANLPTGEGIYFATTSGAGTKDGLTPANANLLSSLLNDTSLKNYPGKDAPRIYVLEDVTNFHYTINEKITLIGAKGGVVGQKVRFQCNDSAYPILKTTNDVSLQYCIIDGKNSNGAPLCQGIKTTGGNLTLENCEITNCTSSASGGGVYFGSTGELTITESTISSCSATGANSYGGGIYLASGTATLKNDTTVQDCTAVAGGYNLYCASGATVNGLTAFDTQSINNTITTPAGDTVVALWE